MSQQWKNAPVFYTVAQLRHNRISNIGAYAPEIQDRMRKLGYIGFAKSTGFAFTLQPSSSTESAETVFRPIPETVERFKCFNSDQTKGFVVEQNALAFQTTDYVNFESFVEDFMLGVEIIHEVVELAEIERLGLRYLDAVVPPDGEAGLATYLTDRVLGIAARLPGGVGVDMSVSETHFRSDEFAVVARTLISGGSLALPIDLQLEKDVVIAPRFREINAVHAVLDTDASIERKRPFAVDALKLDLITLRNAIGIAFDNTVTQAAIAAWKS